MVYLIIFATAVVSIICFNNRPLFDRLALKPYLIFRNNQWDRLITHGFVHGDYMHLFINMIVFWSFGEYIIDLFKLQKQAGLSIDPNARFIILYFGGLIAASIYDLVKMKNVPYYTSIGASGAVSAVVFCSVFLSPMSKIYLMGVLPMPAIVFGLLYLAFETWSARKSRDNINHHAHIFGAMFGFLFPMLTGGLSQIHIFLNGFR